MSWFTNYFFHILLATFPKLIIVTFPKEITIYNTSAITIFLCACFLFVNAWCLIIFTFLGTQHSSWHILDVLQRIIRFSWATMMAVSLRWWWQYCFPPSCRLQRNATLGRTSLQLGAVGSCSAQPIQQEKAGGAGELTFRQCQATVKTPCLVSPVYIKGIEGERGFLVVP